MQTIYFQEAFKKYNERIKHPELNTTPEEVQEFSDRLRGGENLTIMRFNDGEWGFALDIKRWTDLKVKENHPDAGVQLKYSGILLKEVLDSEPDYYVSIDSFTLTDDIFKKDIEPHLEKFPNRLKGGFFNVWSLSTGFKDLFEILKTRKVLLVGPEFLSKLPFHKDHITTDPKRGIYNVQKYVYDVIRYLDKHYEPNMVIVYSCSFIAKVAINEIYKLYGDSLTQLDMGASLNPYVEYNNRPWFDEIIKQLEEENFYRRTKIHPTAYIEEDVEIGDNVKIGPFCIVRKGAKIGDDCSFTAYCEIREGVVIGNNTSFGSRCTISAGATVGSNTVIKYGFVLTDTPNLEENDVKVVGSIGDNVLIGANVTLMPGFSIGNNSVIGACSQVRADVGDNEIWFGSPAKLYKKNEE